LNLIYEVCVCTYVIRCMNFICLAFVELDVIRYRLCVYFQKLYADYFFFYKLNADYIFYPTVTGDDVSKPVTTVDSISDEWIMSPRSSVIIKGV
jgi:hypothetical protein